MKNVHRVTRRGKVYRYHRRTGARLPDLPETDPAFVSAWLAEERKEFKPSNSGTPGTVGWACQSFLGSERFRELSPTYKGTMTRHVAAIRMAYEDAPLRGLADRHVEADLARLPVHASRDRLKAWRAVLRPQGCKAAETVRARPAPRTEGHKPWTPAQITAFRAHWPVGTVQRRAFELIYWTAARTIDAVSLAPSHVTGRGVLVFRQHKTDNPAHVPWSCELPAWAAGFEGDRAHLRAALEGAGGATYLATSTGKTRSASGLSNLVAAAARAAGAERSAHGLRKNRLMAIAEACGSAHAIMAWGGHVSMKEAEDYCRAANLEGMVVGVKHSDVLQNAAEKP